ncbi:MAG: hypothetical protein AAGA30_21305, partial [Planctomycetota bacterium]
KVPALVERCLEIFLPLVTAFGKRLCDAFNQNEQFVSANGHPTKRPQWAVVSSYINLIYVFYKFFFTDELVEHLARIVCRNFDV